jgi:hypothetical protein
MMEAGISAAFTPIRIGLPKYSSMPASASNVARIKRYFEQTAFEMQYKVIM